MSRFRLTVLLAVTTAFCPLAGMAQSTAAPADQNACQAITPLTCLNQTLPSWLRFSGEERLRLEGFTGSSFQPNSSDAYVLNRLRLGMNIVPAAWLRFSFEMQDSRVGGKNLKPYAPPYQDTFNLRQSYAEFGNLEQYHVALKVGRQEINLGEERLVGSSNWTNTARTFDAARLSLRQGKFRLDAFASSPVALHDGDVGDHVPGNNLHGLYGGMDNVVPQAKIEPFLFWRLTQRQKTEAGKLGDLDFTTVGIRWVGKIAGDFDYGLEVAKQQGSLGTDSISAWAGHWILGRRFDLPLNPRLFAEYNYATGDGSGADGRRHTFDQLFPSGHEKNGLADLVGWRNIMHGRMGLDWKPGARWSSSIKYSRYWLADAHDALYNSSGTAIFRKADGSAGRNVGSEIDAVLQYQFSKRYSFGGGFAHLFTGSFLQRTTPGKAYNYPYFMLTAAL